MSLVDCIKTAEGSLKLCECNYGQLPCEVWQYYGYLYYIHNNAVVAIVDDSPANHRYVLERRIDSPLPETLVIAALEDSVGSTVLAGVPDSHQIRRVEVFCVKEGRNYFLASLYTCLPKEQAHSFVGHSWAQYRGNDTGYDGDPDMFIHWLLKQTDLVVRHLQYDQIILEP